MGLKVALRGDVWETLLRHARAFLAQVSAGVPIMREQFASIQRTGFSRTFDECVRSSSDFLNRLDKAR